MKFQFIGTGSAFCLENYQTNTIIEEDNKRLLIDAGGDVRWALKDVGLSYKDINALYVTHGHGDHIGGIEYLAFCTYFDPTVEHKPMLYCNKGLICDIWNNALSLGLKSIQGKVVNLRDYFTVNEIDENKYFLWGSGKFELVQAVHIMSGYSIVATYGLMITIGTKKVYMTGDTQFNPNQIKDFYRQADFIIQDCETTPFCSGVHANFNELITLSEDIKNKMYLVHYQDNVVNEWKEWQKKVHDAGFLGFIKKGEIIEF